MGSWQGFQLPRLMNLSLAKPITGLNFLKIYESPYLSAR